MQKSAVPNHQPLGSRVLYNLRHHWRNLPWNHKLLLILLSIFGTWALVMSVMVPPGPVPTPIQPVDLEQVVLATVQTIGALFKTLIVNGGALAKPLVEPMLWIGAFYWAFVLSIGCPYWFTNFMRRKFGR